MSLEKADRFTVSFSGISTYRQCPRLHYWKYVLRVEPIVPPRPTMLGKAVHSVLAELLRNDEQKAYAVSGDLELDPDDESLVKYILQRYLETYQSEHIGTDKLHPVQVEEPFCVPLKETWTHRLPPIFLRGIPDVVVPSRDAPSSQRNPVDIIDHKTTSLSRKDFERRSSNPEQLALYAYALQQLGHSPTHGIYNVIRTKLPSTPRINKDGTLNRGMCDTTHQIYLEAMQKTGCVGSPWKEHLVKLALSGNQFFYRLTTNLDAGLISDVQNEALATALLILESLLSKEWPENNESCETLYGECPFLHICESGPLEEPSDGVLRELGLARRNVRYERLGQVEPLTRRQFAVPTPKLSTSERAQTKSSRAIARSVDMAPSAATVDSGDPILQNALVERLALGGRVFLSGRAGTGKTYLVKLLARALADRGKTVFLTASTGLGASHMFDLVEQDKTSSICGPFTVHSAAFLPWSEHEDHEGAIEKGRRRLSPADVVVVDEISMLDLTSFQRFLLRVHPRTGILAVGDFYQLPPVSEDEEHRPDFSFRNPEFQNFELIELTRVYRQDDPEFIEFLERLRHGENRRSFYSNIPGAFNLNFPVLFGTNREAEDHNRQEMAKIKSPPIYSQCLVTLGKQEAALKWFENYTRARKRLEIKLGMRVLCIQNHSNTRLVNGDLGTVTGISDEEWEGCGPKWLEIDFDRVGSGRLFRYEFQKKVWIGGVDIVELEVVQFPLVPAYGLTVHKSQGMTLEVVNVDGAKVNFAAGQVYVALSRCRTMDGLRVKNSSMFQAFTRPEVEHYYQTASRLNFDESPPPPPPPPVPSKQKSTKKKPLPRSSGSTTAKESRPSDAQVTHEVRNCGYCRSPLDVGLNIPEIVTMYRLRRHWKNNPKRQLKRPVIQSIQVQIPLCGSCQEAMALDERAHTNTTRAFWVVAIAAFIGFLVFSNDALGWDYSYWVLGLSGVVGLVAAFVTYMAVGLVYSRRMQSKGMTPPDIAQTKQVVDLMKEGWTLER